MAKPTGIYHFIIVCWGMCCMNGADVGISFFMDS